MEEMYLFVYLNARLLDVLMVLGDDIIISAPAAPAAYNKMNTFAFCTDAHTCSTHGMGMIPYMP